MASMANGGYVKIYRKVYDHPAFRNAAEASAFVWMVAQAQWKPRTVGYRGYSFALQRGQLVLSVRDMAKAMDRDKGWIERLVKRLIEHGIIMARHHPSATQDSSETAGKTAPKVITICNYEEYQAEIEQGETAEIRNPRQQRDSSKTAKINKEGKKEKKETPPPISPPSPKSGPSAWRQGTPPPRAWIDWAVGERGWNERKAMGEADRFIDWALANGKTYKDWSAAWRNWCRSPYQKSGAPAQAALTL